MKILGNRFIIIIFCLILSFCIIDFTIANSTIGMYNIEHTRTDKTINLSWEINSGNNQADMFIWSPKEQVFKFINTIDIYKKETSLQVLGDGNYTVRFIPLGGGNDIRYSFSVSGASMPKEDIKVVPKTGSTQQFIIILSFSLFIYVIYRWRKTAKNK